MRNYIKKIDNWKYRQLKKIASWIIAKINRPTMDRHGWNLMKISQFFKGYCVISYVSYKPPFSRTGETIFPMGDNCFKITNHGQNEHPHADEECSNKHRDQDFSETPRIRNHPN